MRIRPALILMTAMLALTTASPVRAQRGVIDLTVDVLDRWLKGYETEKSETQKVDPQLQEADQKLKKFRDCQKAFMEAAGLTDSKALGIAARVAMRAKCGAGSEEDIAKERQKILDGPEGAGAKVAGLKLDEYRNLKDKISGYLRGDHTSGFSKNGLDLLASRESALASLMGIALVQAGSTSRGAGIAMPGVWGMDYAWAFVGQLFAIQYLSGATVFEKEYQPGQWTKWQITVSDNPKENMTMERAFIGKTPEGGEWWRYKTTVSNNRDGKDVIDTVTLEGLFKPMGETIKQLVRMRGKLPGATEPAEMIVPQSMAMLPLSGAFGSMRPTPESIEGATKGTETVAGISAKHVVFGMGSGNLEWWIADAAPGGWVKFKATNGGKDQYIMEVVGHGEGAKSELGIKM